MLLKQHRLNCKSLAFRFEYRGIVTEPIVKSIPKLNGEKYLLIFNMFLVVLSTYIPFVFFTKLLVSLFLQNEGIILTPPFFLFLDYKRVCVCVQPQRFARFIIFIILSFIVFLLYFYFQGPIAT